MTDKIKRDIEEIIAVSKQLGTYGDVITNMKEALTRRKFLTDPRAGINYQDNEIIDLYTSVMRSEKHSQGE